MAVAGPIALMLITIDDDVPFDSGCDEQYEEDHGRAACFPAISVFCCSNDLARLRLNCVHAVNVGGCLTCFQDVRLITDGLGKATINR
jgi:hypothetical protein